MKRIRDRDDRMFLLFAAVGFVAGIIYENLHYHHYSDSIALLDDYFLDTFSASHIVTRDYLYCVLRERLAPFLFFCFLGNTRWIRGIAGAFTGGVGFLSGVLAATAVIRRGFRGVFLFVALFFPHFIFYGLSYVILFRCFSYRPNTTVTIRVGMMTAMMFILGIMSELYVLPFLLRVLS